MNESVALQALTNLGPAEQPPLVVFHDCTRRYWVDMWSTHRIPQLHFQLSKPDRYFFIQVTTQVCPITRLSGPRSRPNSLRKILRSDRESNPGPLPLLLLNNNINNNNNNNNNVRSSIRNIGCLQIFSSLLGSWR
jgi:hypothetical protein